MDPQLVVALTYAAYIVAGLLLLAAGPYLLGLRYIPNNRVGVVEKWWSMAGTVAEGQLLALGEESGYRSEVLRGGIHFWYWRWQYKIHKMPLTVISQGKIGYVFARDGRPLRPEQTLAHVVPCNNFQNARAFLAGEDPKQPVVGQRGRQRAILREGVYAINLALFIVITEENTFVLRLGGRDESAAIAQWHQELRDLGGFNPVVVSHSHGMLKAEDGQGDGHDADNIGIVTTHDGPGLEPGKIIAPPVGTSPDEPGYHANYQIPEAFLAAGGRRGRQYTPLTDGTYFINRWFASVELIPKTVVPIGHVGVVVSYFGEQGIDLSGDAFRHGERVEEGGRGVQAKTLSPGKYAFNAYAGHVHLIPTTNFVLHWITGRSEVHHYDESLMSIELVTADAYEPSLPLSVVVHIDYQKAPSVIQRFGDVKKLITQTLDPMLSAYFRDIAHKKTMLELLHDRDVIQDEARAELRRRFADFDIELVDVLIGKPQTVESSGEIETLLEQLRVRQLSREQIETYQRQCEAAEELKTLKLSQARAERQTELTNSQIEIEIAENRGAAELSQARKRAEQTVVTAEAEKQQKVLAAEAEGRSRAVLGEGKATAIAAEGQAEADIVLRKGQAEADVLKRKIVSYVDPKLYAVSQVARSLSQSRQPLVPERLFMTGAATTDDGQMQGQGMLGMLLAMLVADKAGFPPQTAEDLVVGQAVPDMEEVQETIEPVDPEEPGSGTA